jgi:hypothetical protein
VDVRQSVIVVWVYIINPIYYAILADQVLLAEHSKQNWHSHKPVCKKLSKAEWTTLPFNVSNPNHPVSVVMSQKSPIQLSSPTVIRDDTKTCPPNAHGSEPFIIKLQIDVQGRSHILIYDQKRTIEFQLFRSNYPPDIWMALDQTLMAHGLLGGVKLFIWARRKSNWELSLALDRLPESTIPW